MASSTQNSSKTAGSPKSTRSEPNVDTARGTKAKSDSRDAITLLKADHKQVAEWFEQFEAARSDKSKRDLAQQICAALTVHATIEEEIFYPAFLDATGATDLHHEAEIEHQGAKNLIAEIEESGPDDEYFDARVTVLAELIRHHVNEEEQRDGMFAKAKESEMDLKDVGEQLQARKDEMTDKTPPQRRQGGQVMANQGNNQGGNSSNRGFAKMDEEKQREIARKGGSDSGGNFANDPERASDVGRKGGESRGKSSGEGESSRGGGSSRDNGSSRDDNGSSRDDESSRGGGSSSRGGNS